MQPHLDVEGTERGESAETISNEAYQTETEGVPCGPVPDDRLHD